MTISINSEVKTIENKNNSAGNKNKTIAKSTEKKISATKAVILGTSLSALASLGTYLVMKGKNKKALNIKQIDINSLTKSKESFEGKCTKLKETIESLKRELRSKEDFIEMLEAGNKNKSSELSNAQKELFKLREKIRELECKIKDFGGK